MFPGPVFSFWLRFNLAFQNCSGCSVIISLLRKVEEGGILDPPVQPALGLSAELILNMGVAHDGASAI